MARPERGCAPASSPDDWNESVMRVFLDKLYLLNGYLAGVFLVGMLVTIIAQVVGRWLPWPVDMVEISGFCLSSMTFLALAYALGHGSHIRINLLIRNFTGQPRRGIELWCSGVGAVAMGFLAYNVVIFNYQTYLLGDKTLGLIIFGIWIPQLAFSLGTVTVTIAFLDEFVRVLRGGIPRYEANIKTELSDVGPIGERPAATSAATSD